MELAEVKMKMHAARIDNNTPTAASTTHATMPLLCASATSVMPTSKWHVACNHQRYHDEWRFEKDAAAK